MGINRVLPGSLGSLILASIVALAQTGGTSEAKPSAAGAPSSPKHSAADRSFMDKAAQGGMAEVALGQLAEQNGQSQEVKDFGKHMVNDHSKANDELKALASQQGVTLPADISAQDNATKDRLSRLHGEAFDKAYMKDMVSDHRQDVAEFKKESASGKDPQVKEWASQTLPTLENHLKMAEQVYGKVGGTAAKTKSGKSVQNPSSADAARQPSSQPQW